MITISGRCGVGKDTIINEICRISDYQRFPSVTTRTPRTGEINGVHYKFVSKTVFYQLHLMDRVEITGELYGVSLDGLQENSILNLTTQSALLFKTLFPETITVYIHPPSSDCLIERMRKRGMSDEKIYTRIMNDPNSEIQVNRFDFCIVSLDGEVNRIALQILRRIEYANEWNSILFACASFG